jgi:hypothetical protein
MGGGISQLPILVLTRYWFYAALPEAMTSNPPLGYLAPSEYATAYLQRLSSGQIVCKFHLNLRQ